MEEYYRKLAANGKADSKYHNLHIFKIGEEDVIKFPELENTWQLWVLSSGKIQLISYEAVAYRGRNKNVVHSY